MHEKSINAEQFYSLMIDIIMRPTTETGKFLSIFNFLFIESIANELLGDKNPFCAERLGGGQWQKQRENEKTTSSYCISSDNNQSFRIKSIESVGWHSLVYKLGGNAHQAETPDRNALDKRIIMVIEYFLNLKIDCAMERAHILKMA